MNARLLVAGLWVPAPVRRRFLDELVRAAARGFGRPRPEAGRRSYRKALAAFRDFTRESGEAALASGRSDPAAEAAVREALFANGRLFGARLRSLLKLETGREAMSAARILYRAIGIDFRGDSRGRVVVRACGFSRAYSAGVCRVVSALDAGVLAGLHGGGRFRFVSRITEGAPACEGVFEPGGEGG